MDAPAHSNGHYLADPAAAAPAKAADDVRIREAQIRRCAQRAGVACMASDFVEDMRTHTEAEVGRIVARAVLFKNPKRKTLRVPDIVRAYGHPVLGAREKRRSKARAEARADAPAEA